MDAFSNYAAKNAKIQAAVIYPSVEVKELLEAMLSDYPQVRGRVSLLSNDQQVGGRRAYELSTISLITALAGLPGAIVYR